MFTILRILEHILTFRSLRIGTFNVNGKLPSQDLASWIRGPTGARNASVVIPPLKEVSPLSLGEVARDPFDSGKYPSIYLQRI
jgi:phosphatidylinositol-bisphosphatase